MQLWDGNAYCEGIRLKIHSTLANASLILKQIKFKITQEKFISEELGSISAKNSMVSLPGECSLVDSTCW